jgi:hypothetical protein
VQAVAREFVRRDIIPRVASLCPLGNQVSDDSAEVLLGSGDVLASMQECREFGAVVLMGNEGEGLEHGFEPLASAASLAPSCQATRIASTSGKYLYKVARPMPVSSATCDMVTDSSPCFSTSEAVVSRVASRTARRCVSIVLLHSLGMGSSIRDGGRET